MKAEEHFFYNSVIDDSSGSTNDSDDWLKMISCVRKWNIFNFNFYNILYFLRIFYYIFL